MTTIYVLNGPNLNLLGVVIRPSTAEPSRMSRIAVPPWLKCGFALDFRQTNHEVSLWTGSSRTQVAAGQSAGVVLNAGAYTPRSR